MKNRITINLTEQQYGYLRQYSKENNVSLSFALNVLVKNNVELFELKRRRRYLRTVNKQIRIIEDLIKK